MTQREETFWLAVTVLGLAGACACALAGIAAFVLVQIGVLAL